MSRNSIRKNCCTDVLTHFRRLRFTEAELEQRDKSRKIDKFLEKDKNSFRRQVAYLRSINLLSKFPANLPISKQQDDSKMIHTFKYFLKSLKLHCCFEVRVFIIVVALHSLTLFSYLSLIYLIAFCPLIFSQSNQCF